MASRRARERANASNSQNQLDASIDAAFNSDVEKGDDMRIESGVMIMKDGKAWGEVYSDGRSTSYGWVDQENATIHDPRFCKRPEDIEYEGGPNVKELRTGKLVHVERRTQVILKEMT